ncbi:MAG TPA: OmpA family protein [Rhizomicrobium sp.]|nr:OmpA family protein [Rhizomicrobium sp.]
MRSIRVLMMSSALAACGALPAAAQQMYPGQGISVNPNAAGVPVLLYPGGNYVPLAQPGGPNALEPIHLHMPVSQHMTQHVARVHHRAHVASVAPVEAAPVDTTPPVADVAPPAPIAEAPAPTHHGKHVPKTDTPPPAPVEAASTGNSDASIPFSFTGNTPPKPATKSSPAKVASTEPPPAQTAPAEDHAAKPDDAGLSKRGEIVFKHGATDPAPAQFDGLKMLAGDLTSALQAGAAKIMLEAYGGAPGDKGSDARRLSLKRALAIRQILIDNGVPSTKIDLRAMGGIDDKGNADRVDVYVRA